MADYDPIWINALAGAPSYTANELRAAMALMANYNGRNVGGRQGVRPGGTQLNASFANPNWTVQPGVALLDPGLSAAQGPYWAAVTAAETGAATAAHATLPRKDILYLQVQDNDEDASGQRRARVAYLAGTAAGSPAEPAVPTGGLRLATLDVPAASGGGLGSATITNNFTYTVASGGILLVRSATEESALSPYQGMLTYRTDTGLFRVRGAAAFRDLGEVTVCTSGTRPAHSEGRIIYEIDTDYTLVSNGTAWVLPLNIPGGKVDLATPVTVSAAFTTETDIITGNAITLVAGRAYKITGSFSAARTTSAGAAGDVAVVRLKVGATIYKERPIKLIDNANAAQQGGIIQRTLRCTADIAAGSTTFKMSAVRTSGAGNWQIDAAANSPIELLVEDLGD